MRLHLASHNIRAKLLPDRTQGHDRLEVEQDIDVEVVRAIVEQWER